MKTDKNFRLSKATKIAMENILDKNQRNAFKKTMIQAEHSFNENKKRKLRMDKDSSDEE